MNDQTVDSIVRLFEFWESEHSSDFSFIKMLNHCNLRQKVRDHTKIQDFSPEPILFDFKDNHKCEMILALAECILKRSLFNVRMLPYAEDERPWNLVKGLISILRDDEYVKRHKEFLKELDKVESDFKDETAGKKVRLIEKKEEELKKGVALRDFALMLNDNDKESTQKTVKKWQNSVSVKLPLPIGKHPVHKQINLYEPTSLIEAVSKIEWYLNIDKGVYVKRLKSISVPPSHE